MEETVKKRIQFRAVLRAASAAVVVFAATVCTNPVSDILNSKSLGLVGTWKNTNPSYIALTTPPQCYNLVINGDGTFRASDSSINSTSGTYSIGSVSTQGSVRTYTIHFQWSPAQDCYAFVQVTNATTYEINGKTFLPYPTSIDPSGMSASYSKFTLQ